MAFPGINHVVGAFVGHCLHFPGTLLLKFESLDPVLHALKLNLFFSGCVVFFQHFYALCVHSSFAAERRRDVN